MVSQWLTKKKYWLTKHHPQFESGLRVAESRVSQSWVVSAPFLSQTLNNVHRKLFLIQDTKVRGEWEKSDTSERYGERRVICMYQCISMLHSFSQNRKEMSRLQNGQIMTRLRDFVMDTFLSRLFSELIISDFIWQQNSNGECKPDW